MSHPDDCPLTPDDFVLLDAIREVWCANNGIPEESGERQQVMMDLIDWYQCGWRNVEALYLRLNAEARRLRELKG